MRPPGASPADLPPIAAKADDLEAIKKAVDDAASVSGGLWLSYLFVLFYFAVAAGAVTHADLFLENPVKLPFLTGIELPLVSFFFIAPILFVIVHAYTLVHLVFLTDKAKRFHQTLYAQISDQSDLREEESKKRRAIRDGLRRQLASNIFIQFLAGPTDIRESAFGWLLRAIGWVTLVIAPILLLLLMQVQFLPFHSSFVTWTQRVALVADLALVWWLWRKILSGREMSGPRTRVSLTWAGVGIALSFCSILFSWTVATFPGEWQEDNLQNIRGLGGRLSIHDILFKISLDPNTRRPKNILSNTLILSNLNIYEGLKIDDPQKAQWHDFFFRARGRDLKGATLDLANLPKVDFEGADLRGASLFGARLQGASLSGAQLLGAVLDRAQFQGTRFDHVQLQGVSLRDAQLQGAWLVGESLQGAMLDGAQLQGAVLYHASLGGASLDGTQLQGAVLDEAQLQGASLRGAQLQGASMRDTLFIAADLSGASLWRTNPPLGAFPKITAIRLSDDPDPWKPSSSERYEARPWDDRAYQDLRQMMESIPTRAARDQALENIRTLDCSNPDKTLASCDPSLPSPLKAVEWRKAVEAASVDEKAYTAAFVKALKDIICSDRDKASPILIVRGAGFRSLLSRGGTAAMDLIDDLTRGRKDCPVSAALTESDVIDLLQIKNDIELSN
jgi:uncharacterized protein YjbI with pentapeptide repeats